MRRPHPSGLLAALFCALLGLVPAPAARAADEPRIGTELKRADVPQGKHPSLQFLRDNRMFIRGQLDRLRLLTTRTTGGEATPLDPRLLRLQELAAAVAAARDTVADATLSLARRDLLDSVTRLGELEARLDLMADLAADQRQRLGELEADYLGRQETALVVLVRGLPADAVPAGLVLGEQGTYHAVDLDPTDRKALRRGGVAQVLHRYVEPRDHLYSLAFTGAGWDSLPAVAVPVAAARDRITFLELDLSRLDPAAPARGLDARTWER